MDRRRFLSMLGGGAVGFGGAYLLFRSIDPGPGRARVNVRDYLAYGPDAALKAITSNQDFYVTSKGLTPYVDRNEWSLTIDGVVEQPLRFSFQEIESLPALERTLTLECISNPVGGPWIGNARWRGTPLRPLLERARPRAEAQSALLYAADGFTTGIPLERLFAEDNFLAYGMNGEPLPRAHGFPLRVFFPGKYGMKQPKWLTRIELLPEHQLGYWEKRGWSDTAERQTRAVIDYPRADARLQGPGLLVAGYAVADASGIQQVEISLNEGESWQKVEIVSNPSPYIWTFWQFSAEQLGTGKHELLVRGINGRGEVQIAEENPPAPSGATGYHRISVSLG